MSAEPNAPPPAVGESGCAGKALLNDPLPPWILCRSPGIRRDFPRQNPGWVALSWTCWSPPWTCVNSVHPQRAMANRWSPSPRDVWFHLKPRPLSEPSACQHLRQMPWLYWETQQAIDPDASPVRHLWLLQPPCLLQPLFIQTEGSCPHGTKLFHSLTLKLNVRFFSPGEKGDGKMEGIIKHSAWLPRINKARKPLSVWDEKFNVWLGPREE